MKFYESGDNRKPVIFLFPGTCCLYSSFDHVLDGLHSYFYTVTVSYDGFDPNEKTEFYSMEYECEKIEQEIRKKYGGRIYLLKYPFRRFQCDSIILLYYDFQPLSILKIKHF